MIVGDVANFVLGGIPGDLHDLFVTDVEPADLAQASALLQAMSDSARAIHVKLSGSVASLEGRWQGAGSAAFDSEIWQPLSDGLGVLKSECATASTELAQLAVQAEQAHLYKVEELNQEIQNQLWIFAGTSLIGGPALGAVISDAVGGVAARLGGELVGRMVTGIVDAINTLLRKVLDAFGEALNWVAGPLRSPISAICDGIRNVFGKSLMGGGSTQVGTPTAWGPWKPTGITDPQLRGIADQLYRPGASIGNGGTADAIRAGLGHQIKGAERITQLVRWLGSHPAAAPADIHAAQSMLQDLISAMNGGGFPEP